MLENVSISEIYNMSINIYFFPCYELGFFKINVGRKLEVNSICYNITRRLSNGEAMLFACNVPVVRDRVHMQTFVTMHTLILCGMELYGRFIPDIIFNT